MRLKPGDASGPANRIMNHPLDITRRSPHGLGNRVGRILWTMVYVFLFRTSPRPFHRWRNLLLRLFGAKLHPTARVYPRARIWSPANLEMEAFATISDDVDVYCVDRITLGECAIVSQYSYLCGATHDFEQPKRPIVSKPIVVERDVWIAADVFVSPGVTIGHGAVVGARSSVFSDLAPNKVYFGTPAREVRDRKYGSTEATEKNPPPDMDQPAKESKADTHVSA